jgi:hypothetical protein
MIHERIKNRIEWFKELWLEILQQVKDEEIARIIYKRVVFEE